MKIALIYLLCGIAITVSETYGNKFHLLVGKMKDAKILTDKSEMLSSLVSIEVNNKHYCTGNAVTPKHAITAALYANDIKRYIQEAPAPRLTVSYGTFLPRGNTQNDIINAAVPLLYLAALSVSTYRAPFIPYSIGIIEVSEFDLQSINPIQVNALVDITHCSELSVIGWSHMTYPSNPPRLYRGGMEKLEIIIMDTYRCAFEYNIAVSQIPDSLKCIKPVANRQGRLEGRDIGSPVIINGVQVAVVTHIGKLDEPVIITLLSQMIDEPYTKFASTFGTIELRLRPRE